MSLHLLAKISDQPLSSFREQLSQGKRSHTLDDVAMRTEKPRERSKPVSCLPTTLSIRNFDEYGRTKPASLLITISKKPRASRPVADALASTLPAKPPSTAESSEVSRLLWLGNSISCLTPSAAHLLHYYCIVTHLRPPAGRGTCERHRRCMLGACHASLRRSVR